MPTILAPAVHDCEAPLPRSSKLNTHRQRSPGQTAGASTLNAGDGGGGGARGGWLGEGEANGVRGQRVLVIGVWLVACRVPSGHHARAQEGHSVFDNRCISERAGARRSHGAPPHLLRVYRPAGRMWIQRNCQAMAWRTNKTVGAPPRLLRVYCPAGRTRLQRNRQALAWRTKKNGRRPVAPAACLLSRRTQVASSIEKGAKTVKTVKTVVKTD
jgi:hypothetical protein